MYATSNYSKWVHEYIKLGGKRDFTLHFKAVHGTGSTHIALDDFEFLNCEAPYGECLTNTEFTCVDGSCILHQYVCDAKYDCIEKSDEYQCPNVKGNCNFDSPSWLNKCDYKQLIDDDIDWQQAFSSSQPSTGPPYDHTLGSNGQFLYVSSNDGTPGKLATLQANFRFPASVGFCYLRYWYYMHSDLAAQNVDIGTLKVFLKVTNGQRYPASSVSGNLDAAWEEVVLPISMDREFTVLFEAETGTSIHTYIAIDDVSFTPECESGVGPPPANNTCSSNEFECNTGECIPEGFFCDCFYDCLDGSDELDCSTTCSTIITRSTTSTTPGSTISTTTTTLNPNACSEAEFPCQDTESNCIPGLYLCDGISDCPNQQDEKECPEKTPCDPGLFYCSDFFMTEHPCLRNSDLCNGIVTCNTYNADESFCGDCQPNYCQHQGACSVVGKTPTCNCTSGYTGNRCERSGTPPGGDGGLGAGPIVGITLASLAFVILLGVGVFYYKKKKQYQPQREESDWDNPDNTVFTGLDLPMPPQQDEYPLEEIGPGVDGVADPKFLDDYDESSHD